MYEQDPNAENGKADSEFRRETFSQVCRSPMKNTTRTFPEHEGKGVIPGWGRPLARHEVFLLYSHIGTRTFFGNFTQILARKSSGLQRMSESGVTVVAGRLQTQK